MKESIIPLDTDAVFGIVMVNSDDMRDEDAFFHCTGNCTFCN